MIGHLYNDAAEEWLSKYMKHKGTSGSKDHFPRCRATFNS